MNNPDRDLLQSIIDGNTDGMNDPAFADSLIEMHERVKDDKELFELFNQATIKYSDYADKLWEDVLAKNGVSINADVVDINEEVFHGDVGYAHVIEAAISWGDWVKQQDGVTQEQREIVERVQEALKQYPNVVRGLVAEYGFELTDNRYLEWENSEEGMEHWDNTDLYKPPETVKYTYCVSYFASNDPTRITNIEIFKNIDVSPSRDSIGWDENEILFERLVPEGDIEISIDVSTRKRQYTLDEQRAKELIDWKSKLANEFDTKARENPQGYTREWEITQNWI